ncbi:MAG: hypothetical protein AAGC93_11655 [Cyanobacteria bacterium P01_F01_bin.53]
MDGFAQNVSETFSDATAAGLNAGRSDANIRDPSLCASPFQEAFQATLHFVRATFATEMANKQLFYHGMDHVQSVVRRSCLIFDTVLPFLDSASESSVSWERQRRLLQLSALAHDMIQVFVPQVDPHVPRQRESGRSEAATFEQLRNFMIQLDCTPDGDAVFTAADIALVREAISATVCHVDPIEGAIYQPLLYPSLSDCGPLLDSPPSSTVDGPSLSLGARCLALADIGTLGMDGIEAYQREGSLLLLEENLDVVDFLLGKAEFDDALQEGLRQRLLKRARFQVAFAKSRLARLDAELQGLPDGAIAIIKQQVFQYLTPETITAIVETTPTDDDTSLSTLLAFFNLSAYLSAQPQSSS